MNIVITHVKEEIWTFRHTNVPTVGPGRKSMGTRMSLQHAKDLSKQKHDSRQINDGGIIAVDNFSRLNQFLSPLIMSKQTLVSLQLQTPA